MKYLSIILNTILYLLSLVNFLFVLIFLLFYQRDVVLSGIGTIDGLQDILVNNKVPGEKATAIKTSVFGLSVSRLSTNQVSDIQIGTTSLHGIGQFQLPDSKEFYHNLTRNQTDGTVDIQV